MGENTGISWTEHTWNPWHGCIKVSPGCKFCYMYTQKRQYGQDPMLVVRSKTKFDEPLSWKEPAMVFTCSWSDWFIDIADAWRPAAWDIIRRTPHLTYQILTKRPQRIAQCLPSDWDQGYPNVWLGVSCESQQYADERIPALLNVPAKIHFVSAEPLLEPILFHEFGPEISFCWLEGFPYASAPIPKIDWVIVGGESGPERREFRREWAELIRDQCKAAGAKFYMKQMGAINPKKGAALIPPELLIQEFPA